MSNLVHRRRRCARTVPYIILLPGRQYARGWEVYPCLSPCASTARGFYCFCLMALTGPVSVLSVQSVVVKEPVLWRTALQAAVPYRRLSWHTSSVGVPGYSWYCLPGSRVVREASYDDITFQAAERLCSFVSCEESRHIIKNLYALWCLEGTTLSNRGQRPRIRCTPPYLCLEGSTPEDGFTFFSITDQTD